MNRWLRQNISLIFISFVLAFFFWAVATETEDPTRQDSFLSGITLEVRGVREGITYYNLTTARVWIEMKAPESVWDALTLNDIEAYIDLSSVPTGTIEVPVQVNVARRPLTVVSVSPPTVDLVVESIAEKEVPVSVKVEGKPALGYKTDTPTVSPAFVRVQGPASLVERVVTAEVIATVENEQSAMKSDYGPVLLDRNGEVVPEVTVIPKTVTVDVPVWQLGYIRDLAVTVSLEGQPSPGYRIANLVVDPPIVKVFGRTDIVQAAPGFLQTEPIYLEAITQSITTKVALRMLEGLALLSPPRPEVTATLTVEVIRSGLTLELEPIIVGLRSEYTATVDVDRVVVILSGPLVVMEELNVNEVRLTLDVIGLSPGDYTIVPKVNVPRPEVTIENVIPEAVPVKIRMDETPNPGFS